jgi:pimeloyl-ACP methyl ester carboxylesterase
MTSTEKSLSAEAEAWRGRGRMVEACGHQIFVIDEGAGGGTPLLVIHGFPTSSYDFHQVWPALAAKRRVVALDLPGFGFSSKPADYSYSLLEQADVVEVVARRLGLEKVHVWAHDMGTSVATELLARREAGLLHFALDRLVLMNGSVHAEMARLTPSQKLLRRPWLGPFFARIASRRTYVWQLRRILARELPREELDDQYSLLRRDGGYLRLPAIIRYYDERIRFRRRWIGALEKLDRPALILWGERDPVAVIAIAEKLAGETPGAKLVRLPGVGHFPQLETPAEVVAQLELFLETAQ